MKKRIVVRSLVAVGVLGVVGILGVFGGVAAGVFSVVPGASILSIRYWKSLCKINSQEYATNMNELRRKLGLSFVEEEKVRSSRGHRLVPGPIIQGSFEGDPDQPIDLINYDIPCKYPPYSISQNDSGRQALDEQPKPLPKYCYEITPTPTPPPPPTTKGGSTPTATAASAASPSATANISCHSYSCPTPTPVPSPIDVLGKTKVQSALEESNDGNTAPRILEAVGALKVRLTDSTGTADSKADSEFWGTGFVIADHVFAITCHVLEPLFDKDKDGKPIKNHGTFRLRRGVKLSVDFTPGYPNYAHPDSTNEVAANYIDCSRQTGLDVALLYLDPTSPSVPMPVTLYFDDLEYLEAKPVVLVSYIDLLHPLDEITNEMYQPFVDAKSDDGSHKYGPYWKFAMVDGIVAARRCVDVDMLLDLADTSVGSSGALVLSIFKEFDPHPATESRKIETRKAPLVVGLHKCCAAYFGEEKGYDPPPDIPCAALHRTPINQDVSTVSILKDDTLLPILKLHDVKVENNDGRCLDEFSKCKKK